MDDRAARVTPVVVVLPAEIDVNNSEQVYDQLAAALTPGVGAVIADLTATFFCDSSGLHAITHAYETAAGRDIRLRLAIAPDGAVRRVFQLTGVAQVMPVYPSLEEAINAV